MNEICILENCTVAFSTLFTLHLIIPMIHDTCLYVNNLRFLYVKLVKPRIPSSVIHF